MPLNWTIDHDLRLVTARAQGALSAEDIKAYLGSIAAEGGMPYAKLFDICEADAALTVADLQTLGRSIRQYAIDGYGPLGPLAIVVGQGQSHFQAAFFADDVVLLAAGRVEQWGPMRDLVRAPATPFVAEFVRAQRAPLEALREAAA